MHFADDQAYETDHLPLRKYLLFAALALLTLSGCRYLERSQGYTGGYCTEDAECQPGLTCMTEAQGFPGGYCTTTTCTEGGCPGSYAECAYLDESRNSTFCVETCASNIDCRSSEGYICADLDGSQGCLPSDMATTGAGEIGSSCSRDDDCNTSLCLTNYVFGYCSQVCSSDSDCGSGALCVDQGGGTLRCMDSCSNNDECRFGYTCVAEGSGGVCDVDEGNDSVRNPSGSEDGSTCTDDISCAGGSCLTGSAYPDGYCSTRDCDVVGCGTNSTCVTLDRDAFCLQNCTDSDDCREGYRCTSLEGGGSVCYTQSAISTPDVENGSVFDLYCDSSSIGQTHTISFDIASSTTGFAVIPFSPAGSEIVPTQMTLPDNTNVVFEEDYTYQTVNSLLLSTIVPMTFPGAPKDDYTVQNGRYDFQFQSDDSSCCYYLIEQSGLGTTLDVNIYLVGVPGVSAATASSHSNFQTMLSTISSIYQSAGITVDEVRLIDVTGEAESTYQIIRDFNDVYRLFALSEPPGDTVADALSLNLFLIEDFNISSLPGLLGLSAGIPGAPGIHGSGGSGVVMSSVNLSSDPAQFGQTVAHEMGHFLGLRHTSERGGVEFDPLSDTPQCNDPDDAYNCSDVSNLMFPFAVDVDQSVVTSDQSFVLQRNPIVQ